jgi:hypothetical protein
MGLVWGPPLFEARFGAGFPEAFFGILYPVVSAVLGLGAGGLVATLSSGAGVAFVRRLDRTRVSARLLLALNTTLLVVALLTFVTVALLCLLYVATGLVLSHGGLLAAHSLQTVVVTPLG